LIPPLIVMSPAPGNAAPVVLNAAGNPLPKLRLPTLEFAQRMMLPEIVAAEVPLVLMTAPRVLVLARPVRPAPLIVRNSPVDLPFRSRVAPEATVVKLVVALFVAPRAVLSPIFKMPAAMVKLPV